jgi:hypothetical protein
MAAYIANRKRDMLRLQLEKLKSEWEDATGNQRKCAKCGERIAVGDQYAEGAQRTELWCDWCCGY